MGVSSLQTQKRCPMYVLFCHFAYELFLTLIRLLRLYPPILFLSKTVFNSIQQIALMVYPMLKLKKEKNNMETML